MGSLLRSVLSVLLGTVVGLVIIAGIEAVAHAVYPLPPGINPMDPAALKAAMADLPVRALLFVLLAWATATLIGAWLSARMVRRSRMLHGMIVGVLLLVGGIANMLMIPHPVWFWVLGVALFLPAAYLGAKLAMGSSRRGEDSSETA